MADPRQNFILTVWKHLLTRPNYQALMSSLAHPQGPADVAWKQLQATDSKLKKTGALKTCISSRSDIFEITQDPVKGQPLVALTTGALAFDPAMGLPDRVPNIDFSSFGDPGPGVGEECEDCDLDVDPAELAAAEASLAAPAAEGPQPPGMKRAAPVGLKRVAPPGLPGISAKAAPPAKASKTKTQATGSYRQRRREHPWKAVWGHSGDGPGFKDIVWTPQRQEAFDVEVGHETRMVWALYEAVKLRGKISVSQLGADFDVAKLKKLDQFKNAKFSDIVKQFELIFELTSDTQGLVVSLTETAEAHLPELNERLALEMQPEPAAGVEEGGLLQSMSLPDRILEPQTARQRLQALWIEIIHCLYRRGGRAELTNLGQDYLVQQAKDKVSKGSKLIDFVKAFPRNFGIEMDAQTMYIRLMDGDVSDESGIDGMLLKQSGGQQWAGKGRGRGLKGAGKHGGGCGHVVMPTLLNYPARGGCPGVNYQALGASFAPFGGNKGASRGKM